MQHEALFAPKEKNDTEKDSWKKMHRESHLNQVAQSALANRSTLLTQSCRFLTKDVQMILRDWKLTINVNFTMGKKKIPRNQASRKKEKKKKNRRIEKVFEELD